VVCLNNRNWYHWCCRIQLLKYSDWSSFPGIQNETRDVMLKQVEDFEHSLGEVSRLFYTIKENREKTIELSGTFVKVKIKKIGVSPLTFFKEKAAIKYPDWCRFQISLYNELATTENQFCRYPLC
jgi:hypothetical protein